LAAPATGTVTYWDNDPKVAGFGVPAYAGGTKSFFLNYRIHGRERRITIGPFRRWSVSTASDRAKDRSLVDQGHDPAGEKRERREAPIVPYDLRHTFASIGAGDGLGLPIIGKLLGHTQARTTQRYAHLADDPLREAVEKITTVIAGAGKPGAKIVNIRG
jgi:integrase